MTVREAVQNAIDRWDGDPAHLQAIKDLMNLMKDLDQKATKSSILGAFADIATKIWELGCPQVKKYRVRSYSVGHSTGLSGWTVQEFDTLKEAKAHCGKWDLLEEVTC